jgi:hypothetical protein
VRIERPDGTVVRCGVVRDKAGDQDGNACWMAHPLEEVVLGDGDKVVVGFLPARSDVVFSLLVEEP